MLIKTIPIENNEEIETFLKKHKFVGTSFRINVASNDETIETSGGWKILKKEIQSVIKKEGPSFGRRFKAPTLGWTHNFKQKPEMH